MLVFNILLLLCWPLVLASAFSLHEQLLQTAQASPDFIVPITNSDLSLISQAQRDHFTLIVLTLTDDKHMCPSCSLIKKILRKVAHAWVVDYFYLNHLYFVEIDLIDPGNADVFKYLGLKSVPQIWLVPPSRISAIHARQKQRKFDEHGIAYFDNFDIFLEPHAEFKLEEGSLDDQVFKMADWLSISVKKLIAIRQENPYTKFVATFVATFSVILVLKKRGPSFITETVTKRKVYKMVFFVYLLVLLGGFLFLLIQKVPFIAQNDDHQPIYISGGIHYQFGLEIVLVAGVYGFLGATLITLVYLGQYEVSETSQISSEAQKSGLVLFATAMLYVLYSVMTSMFLRKDQEYPYYFTKLF